MNTQKKRISIMGISRRIIQLAAFFIFPGFFITVFSSIKSIYTSIVTGSASLSALAGSIVLTAAVMIITAIMGRFFCGFLCSFGAMGDLFWFIGSKLHLPRPKISKTADRLLKYLKYLLLIAIVILVWTLGLPLLSGTSDPWTVFGMYSSIKAWSDLSGLISIGGALLFLIIAASLFIDRFFCRYLCPLGGIFAIVSKLRIFRIKKPSQKCGSCRACTRRCPMGVQMYKYNEISSGECIDCFNCVSVCPRENITANPAPGVAALIAAGTLTGMFYVGNLADELSAGVSQPENSISATTETSGIYTDGVYAGSADGYRGSTSVEVTVENGNISSIEIQSYSDDNEFFSKAKSAIISEILSAQSTDVDAVSGATFSSRGIINAVANALSGAVNADGQNASAVSPAESSSEISDSSAPDASVVPSENGSDDSASSLNLSDGVYTGTGTGLRGSTDVSVTVSSGKIQSIDVTSYEDDEEFFTRAESTVIGEIIDSQAIDVDAVSGATFSSNSIMEAVADALKIDFTNTNSTLNQHSGGKHH